jgi:leucyl/phenylalanyl-tRNA--protein transferase
VSLQHPVWLELGDSVENFPPVELAMRDPDGLLAVGGDLTSERLIAAYRRGIFPWFSEGQPIMWWSPDPRMVLYPDELKLSRSMRKRIRRQDYEVTLDKAFSAVIRACSESRRDQEGTWITDAMIAAYEALYHQGFAHSVECWMDGELVGGLYGLAMGRVFFGESMFSRVSDASKLAFSHLVRQLQQWQFQLIDCQVYTEHLESLGARLIPRAQFKQELQPAIDAVAVTNWQMAPTPSLFADILNL